MNRITFFNKLIEVLQQSKISYAIIGKSESYLEPIGSDADLKIHVENLEKI